MTGRPNRRQRAAAEGGSSHNFIPLGANDLRDVHAREGHSIKIGSQTFRSPPKRTTQKSNELWRVATLWEPLDDPDFALDLDGTLYDNAVDTTVMQHDTNPPLVAVGTKNAKSKTSVRPRSLFNFLIYMPVYDRGVPTLSGKKTIAQLT
jgi:hypothetical protein